MAFKKVMRGEAEMIIMGGGNHKALFPVGFRYLLGDRVYEVRDRFESDNTEWRRLHCSDGSVEDVTVDTIIEDFKSAGKQDAYSEGTHNPRRKATLKVLHDPDEVPEEPEPAPAPAPAPRKTTRRKVTAKKKVAPKRKR
jgi:hypothetical protein